LNLIKKIIFIIDKNGVRTFSYILFLTIINTFFEVFSLAMIVPFMRSILDTNFFQDNLYAISISNYFGIESYFEFVIFSILAILSVYLIKTIFIQYFYYFKSFYLFDLIQKISTRLFSTYLNQNLNFFEKFNSSYIIKNLTLEVERFSLGFVSHLMELITDTLIIIGILTLILFLQPPGFVFIIISSIFIILTFVYATKNILKDLGKKKSFEEKSKLNSIQNGLAVRKEIILLSLQKLFINFFKIFAGNSAKISAKEMIISRSPRIWFEFLIVLILCTVCFSLILNEIPINEIITLLSLYAISAFRLIPSINRLVSSYLQLRFNISVVDLLKIDLTLNIEEKKSKDHFEFNELNFKNINFHYPAEKNLVIKETDLLIKKGDKVTLIGKSGVGKSTFLSLTMGLLKPTSGQIFINGIEIHKPVHHHLKFSYVPQEIKIIENTILFNITFKDTISEDEKKKLKQIIKVCQLEKFIYTQKQDLFTKISESGSNISAGQKQRLIIARSLFFEPDILILDEATSALDKDTEKNLLQELINEFKLTTIIFVTHKTENLKYFSKNLNIEDKKVLKHSI